jgi:excisionase family DNA binding protein
MAFVKRLTCYAYYVPPYAGDMGEEEDVVLSDAARELGVSHVTAWRHIKSGKLIARRVGPIYLIKRRDLDAFKAARKPAGRPRKPTP